MATTASSKSNSRNRNRSGSRSGGGGGGGQGGRNRGGRNRSRGGGGRGRGNRGRRPEPPKKETIGGKIAKFFAYVFGGEETTKKSDSSKPKSENRGNRQRGGQKGQKTRNSRKSNKPKRTPEQIEVTTERLYVGNLNYDATESDLFDLFNGVGQVRNAEVVVHRYNQRSKGYAFVEMASVEEARRAVDELHDQEFMGRNLWISGAKSEGPKGPKDEESSESVSEEKDPEEEQKSDPSE